MITHASTCNNRTTYYFSAVDPYTLWLINIAYFLVEQQYFVVQPYPVFNINTDNNVQYQEQVDAQVPEKKKSYEIEEKYFKDKHHNNNQKNNNKENNHEN